MSSNITQIATLFAAGSLLAAATTPLGAHAVRAAEASASAGVFHDASGSCGSGSCGGKEDKKAGDAKKDAKKAKKDKKEGSCGAGSCGAKAEKKTDKKPEGGEKK